MKDPVTGKDLIYKDYNGELDDASFRDVSLTQDHYVSVAGGSDRGTFFTSLGYYDEDGMVRGTGYQRFNGSVNASYKVLPILNVKAGATYSWAKKPKLWIGEYEFSIAHAHSALLGIHIWRMDLLHQVGVPVMVIQITIVLV